MTLSKLNPRTFATAAVAGMAALMPLAHAEDQPAPQQYAAASTEAVTAASVSAASLSVPEDITVEPYAGWRAVQWAKETEGVAVSVALGTESKFKPEDIRDILTNDFVKAGEPNVKFFFEQNDISSTSVTYHYGVTGGASAGPFVLNESQDAVQAAVDQNHFYEDNPELGV